MTVSSVGECVMGASERSTDVQYIADIPRSAFHSSGHTKGCACGASYCDSSLGPCCVHWIGGRRLTLDCRHARLWGGGSPGLGARRDCPPSGIWKTGRGYPNQASRRLIGQRGRGIDIAPVRAAQDPSASGASLLCWWRSSKNSNGIAHGTAFAAKGRDSGGQVFLHFLT